MSKYLARTVFVGLIVVAVASLFFIHIWVRGRFWPFWLGHHTTVGMLIVAGSCVVMLLVVALLVFRALYEIGWNND